MLEGECIAGLHSKAKSQMQHHRQVVNEHCDYSSRQAATANKAWLAPKLHQNGLCMLSRKQFGSELPVVLQLCNCSQKRLLFRARQDWLQALQHKHKGAEKADLRVSLCRLYPLRKQFKQDL